MPRSQDTSQDRYHRRVCPLRSAFYFLAFILSDNIFQAVVAAVQTPEDVSLQAVLSCCRSRLAILLPRWACIFREPLSSSKCNCTFVYRASFALRGRGLGIGSWRVRRRCSTNNLTGCPGPCSSMDFESMPSKLQATTNHIFCGFLISTDPEMLGRYKTPLAMRHRHSWSILPFTTPLSRWANFMALSSNSMLALGLGLPTRQGISFRSMHSIDDIQGGVISGDNPTHYNPANPIRLWIIQVGQ